MKKVAIGAALILGAVNVPVVPEDLTFVGAYQQNYESQFIDIPATATTSVVIADRAKPKWSDVDGNGTVSIAVFKDKTGALQEVQIPDTQYENMGKVGGFTNNPTKTQLASLLNLLLEPTVAGAAIAFDAKTAGSMGSNPTSQTYAHTVTGSNPILYVAIYTNPQNSDKVSGVTYNAVAMTRVGIVTLASRPQTYLYRLVSPATGANNVVVTYTGSPTFGISVATSYTGVNPSSTFVNTTANNTTTCTATLTPNSANNWVVAGGGSNANDAQTASTNLTQRQLGSDPAVAMYDSNGTVPQASTGFSFTSGTTGTLQCSEIAESFEPFIAVTATDDTYFELLAD